MSTPRDPDYPERRAAYLAALERIQAILDSMPPTDGRERIAAVVQRVQRDAIARFEVVDMLTRAAPADLPTLARFAERRIRAAHRRNTALAKEVI